MFPFDNSYARLPNHFYRPVLPDPVAGPRLIRFNTALAEELRLPLDAGDEVGLAAIFSGNSVPAGAFPLAMTYSGHQFGQFNPQLGDGRAILLGEVVDAAGRRRDIQLKGAGPTPFSRRGDGRAALGPVLREYIVSEAMHALGIPTTRALAAVATGQAVQRETLLPGAVFTRVAASHIRVGTFQYFAATGDVEGIRALADHVIARHYPELGRVADGPDRYTALLEAIAARQAGLIARWMAVGFIHGVMNTDNMTVSGETIDFGPCAFLDEYDPGKVFSSIDQRGRYAYANQPGIGQWNMARLAECLLPLIDDSEERAVEKANAALVAFGRVFQDRWLEAFRAKLGLTGARDGDLELVNDLLAQMHESEADFTIAFRALGRQASEPDEGGFTALFTDRPRLGDWLARWRARLEDGREPADIKAAMDAVNPAVIPRNHRIEAVIQAGLSGDFTPFEAMLEVLAHPFEEVEAHAAYREPPRHEERVTRTFCGT